MAIRPEYPGKAWPSISLISLEKIAGPTLNVKKIDAPNQIAALATPTNRKNPITG